MLSMADVLALNDELLGLVRAGIPLHLGLNASRGGMKSRLRKVSDELSADLASGRSLEQAVSARSSSFPPLYAVLLESGVRGGRLTAALESFADMARRLLDYRRLLRLAVLYPLLILVLAGVLITLVVPPLMGALAEVYDLPQEQDYSHRVASLESIARLARYAWWIPAVFVGVLVVAEVMQRWDAPRRLMNVAGLIRWVPGFGKIQRSCEGEILCRWLAELMAQQVPVDRALELAAGPLGDVRLTEQAHRLAERLRAGDRVTWQAADFSPLPRQLVWALRHSRSVDETIATLRRSADFYAAEVEYRSLWWRFAMPLALTVGVGVVSVAALASLTFGPWNRTLLDLSQIGFH